MFLFLIAFISCNTILTPLDIKGVDDIPTTLSPVHCPDTSTLSVSENDFRCISNQSSKRHGPHLKISTSQLDLYFYANGDLISFPWLTTNGTLDIDRTRNFFKQELPIAILNDFLERYPDSDLSQDIAVRIEEQNQTKQQQNKLCDSEHDEMTCIQSEKTISRLVQDNTTFLFVGQNTHFLMDNYRTSQQDVERCQQRCQCSSGPWNSPKIASEYCRSQQKRLPTLDELMAFNTLRSNPNPNFELSANSIVSDIHNFDVVYSEVPTVSNTGIVSLAASINSKNEYSHNENNTSFRCARDYTINTISDKFQNPIHNKPIIPKRDMTTLPDSRGYIDQEYQQSLQKLIANSYNTSFDYGYKNIYMVNDILWNYHLNHSDITEVYNFGTSNQGFPILGFRITSNPSSDSNKPSILINGAHHGDELLSLLYALYNIEFTLENRDTPQVDKWLQNLDLWFIPLVNPDGNWMTLHINDGKNIGRKNGLNTDGQCSQQTPNEGVDLNRNYPFQWGNAAKGSSGVPTSNYYRGDRPASEPETKLMMQLADQEKFVASISWHTHGTMIISPYTIPGLTNPNPDIPWMVAEDLKANTPVQPNGRTLAVKSSMYPVDGTDQDWHYHTHGTIAYIVEGSHHNPESLTIRKDSVLSINPLYTRLLDRVVSGPAVYGFTLKEDGSPLEATVKVLEQSFEHNENWTSRRRDGLFYRLLPKDQTYTIEISAPGYVSQNRKVTTTMSPFSLQTITLQKQP